MNPELFDKGWRLASTVKRVNRNKVNELIHSHYLATWPNNVYIIFGLHVGSRLMGVVTFSTVFNSIKAIHGEETLELSRLYIIDKVPKNAESYFISRCVKLLKRELPSIKILISFADPEHGHSGTVYKAANWKQIEHESKNMFIRSL